MKLKIILLFFILIIIFLLPINIIWWWTTLDNVNNIFQIQKIINKTDNKKIQTLLSNKIDTLWIEWNLQQIDQSTFKDLNWNLFYIKGSSYREIKGCKNIVNGYIKYYNKNICNQIELNAISSLSKEIINNVWKRIVSVYRVEKGKLLSFDEYQNGMFRFQWERVFIWDISTSDYYSLQEDILNYSQIMNILNNNWKDWEVFIILEKWTNRWYIVYLKNNWKWYIDILKKSLDKAVKEIENININDYKIDWYKFKNDIEEKIAKIYLYTVTTTNYCFDCLNEVWNKDIYQWMNWILTLESWIWVCDWYSKKMIYLLDKMWIPWWRKFTWLWCAEWNCVNHSWVWIIIDKVPYLFDPTFELSSHLIENKKIIFWKTNFYKIHKDIFYISHYVWKFNESETIKSIDQFDYKKYYLKNKKFILNQLSNFNSTWIHKEEKFLDLLSEKEKKDILKYYHNNQSNFENDILKKYINWYIKNWQIKKDIWFNSTFVWFYNFIDIYNQLWWKINSIIIDQDNYLYYMN